MVTKTMRKMAGKFSERSSTTPSNSVDVPCLTWMKNYIMVATGKHAKTLYLLEEIFSWVDALEPGQRATIRITLVECSSESDAHFHVTSFTSCRNHLWDFIEQWWLSVFILCMTTELYLCIFRSSHPLTMSEGTLIFGMPPIIWWTLYTQQWERERALERQPENHWTSILVSIPFRGFKILANRHVTV